MILKVVEEISVNWIASSNPKVSRLGIDLLNEAVNNLGKTQTLVSIDLVMAVFL